MRVTRSYPKPNTGFLKTKPNMGFLKTKPKIELVAFFWNGDDFEIGIVPWDFIADEGFRKDRQDS